MQFHLKERIIWLTRHGESMFNIDNRVGGDPELTPKGTAYSLALASFFKNDLQEAKRSRLVKKASTRSIAAFMQTPADGDLVGVVEGRNADSKGVPDGRASVSASGRPSIDGRNFEARNSIDGWNFEARNSIDGKSVAPEKFVIWTSALRRTMFVGDQFNDDEAEVLHMRCVGLTQMSQ
jgi:6-phosphofructo-2-kinase